MRKMQFQLCAILCNAISTLSKEKAFTMFFMLVSVTANAQAFEQVGDTMWDQAGPTYKLISVFVLLAGLFFLGKGIIEGLRGEQGAWVKIGGSLLVFAVWFFAVPPLINFLSAQVKNQNFNDF